MKSQGSKPRHRPLSCGQPPTLTILFVQCAGGTEYFSRSPGNTLVCVPRTPLGAVQHWWLNPGVLGSTDSISFFLFLPHNQKWIISSFKFQSKPVNSTIIHNANNIVYHLHARLFDEDCIDLCTHACEPINSSQKFSFILHSSCTLLRTST